MTKTYRLFKFRNKYLNLTEMRKALSTMSLHESCECIYLRQDYTLNSIKHNLDNLSNKQMED